MNTLFKPYQLAIIQFCAEECKRQKSGELSVAWMVNAYNWAVERWPIVIGNPVEVSDLHTLAALVEPKVNANGFRCTNVTIDNVVIPWQNIDRSIDGLLEAQDRLSAREFYKEYERIHPQNDGNGRVGAILFNLKNGTLWVPQAAPDVFAKTA